jgi:hypothetical protein
MSNSYLHHFHPFQIALTYAEFRNKLRKDLLLQAEENLKMM